MNPRARAQRVRRRVVAIARSPRTRQGLVVAASALIGAWLGLLIGGTTDVPVGPVETQMSLRPSLSGGTNVDIPPLGSLQLDSNAGPLGVSVDVTSINVEKTELILNNPSSLNGLGHRAGQDVRSGLVKVAGRGILAATVGGLLAGLIVFRRKWRQVLLTGATSLAVMIAGAGIGVLTWNARSVAEPRYSGLLASAPSLIGNAQNIVRNFGDYERELANLVTNVSRLYDVASSLPAPIANDETAIRVLHVADIHLNPAAWQIIQSLIDQYEITLVIDSGDLTDHGTSAEDGFLGPISTLGVPYVFVRGNHDSLATQRAVAAEENAVVLDGEMEEVAGLRIIGAGDPRFTPDRSITANDESVIEMGDRLATEIIDSGVEPDVAVVHDAGAGERLDGRVPLVLAGHAHRRSTKVLSEGTRLFIQGSTGGAGLRALETEEPTPVMCSVLYFDAATKRLQAWDDITISGFGDEQAATITRTLAPPAEAGVVPSPTPNGQ